MRVGLVVSGGAGVASGRVSARGFATPLLAGNRCGGADRRAGTTAGPALRWYAVTTYSVSALTPRGDLHTFDGVVADDVDQAEAQTLRLLRAELEAAGTWRGFVRVTTRPTGDMPPQRWLDQTRQRRTPGWVWFARWLLVAAVLLTGGEVLARAYGWRPAWWEWASPAASAVLLVLAVLLWFPPKGRAR